jgi:hypothetical protein
MVLDKGQMLACGTYHELKEKEWFGKIFKVEENVEYQS